MQAFMSEYINSHVYSDAISVSISFQANCISQDIIEDKQM